MLLWLRLALSVRTNDVTFKDTHKHTHTHNHMRMIMIDEIYT